MAPGSSSSSSSRVYEYVPDLELRLSIREGTYLRTNSREHRNDELMLLVRVAQMEKTPQMLAERRLARQLRIRKRLQAKIRAALARNQMLAAGAAAASVALLANEVVLDAEPVAFAVGPMAAVRSQPAASVVNQLMVLAMLNGRHVAAVTETRPMVAEQQVVNASVRVEPLDVVARYKAEQYARKVESAKRARAAKAARKAEADKEAAKAAAAQPIVPARAVTMPFWIRQDRAESFAAQALAALMSRASTNGHVVSDRGSRSAEEARAANRALLKEKAGRMPGVRVKGSGPVSGRDVDGSLISWWEGQVLICCHCHASILSPSAFVMHAGHVEFENPLKLISLFFPSSKSLTV